MDRELYVDLCSYRAQRRAERVKLRLATSADPTDPGGTRFAAMMSDATGPGVSATIPKDVSDVAQVTDAVEERRLTDCADRRGIDALHRHRLKRRVYNAIHGDGLFVSSVRSREVYAETDEAGSTSMRRR